MTSGDREAAAQFFDKLAAKAEKSINSAEVRNDAEAKESGHHCTGCGAKMDGGEDDGI